jgi:hypothetical protein
LLELKPWLTTRRLYCILSSSGRNNTYRKGCTWQRWQRKKCKGS